MSLKRNTQHLIRKAKSFIKSFSTKSNYLKSSLEQIKVSCPEQFDTALFNLSIDFELIWGNGNISDTEHSYERRVNSAKAQADNFRPFMDMLKDLDFPITWAIQGMLADHSLVPNKEAEFSPSWANGSWYDHKYNKLSSKLWDGTEYLDCIKNQFSNHEVMSHGYAHIDYSDQATRTDVASWDMQTGITLLKKAGFDVNGFVYPCNKVSHKPLLKENKISIIRGESSTWHIDNNLIQTPIGFWISPAIYTVNEVKEIIDLGIENKSFIHPWMHLIECDLKQNDIEKFYKPILSYVKELESKGKIKNCSFNEIVQTIRPSS